MESVHIRAIAEELAEEHGRLPEGSKFKKQWKGLAFSNILLGAVIVALCLLLDWKKVLLTHFFVLAFLPR